MYVPLPVKNTFIQFDSVQEPLLLLPKSTTAPAEYHPAQLRQVVSRTVSTQTHSTPTSIFTAGCSNNSPSCSIHNKTRTGSFYAVQKQTAKSETDSEPALDDTSIPEDEEEPLQEGQLRVTSDRCGVQWAPDSKRLGRHSTEHQVVSSRFELQVCGQSLGFLLMIRPARTQNRRGVVRAAFKNTQQRQIQLKCLDDLEGLQDTCVLVNFTVGTEQRCLTYDFQSPVCEPAGDSGLWTLPSPKGGEKPVVIKVSISAAPSRW